MAVKISETRVAKVIEYDLDLVDGDTADMRCTNPDGGDVSTRDGFENDGNVFASFPIDYHGTCNVEITGSDGGEDTGTIEV